MFISIGDAMADASLHLFNAQWYLSQNSDVAAAVARGEITAQEHFELFGKTEGRSAGPLFNATEYLQGNPDVAAAVARGGAGRRSSCLGLNQRAIHAINARRARSSLASDLTIGTRHAVCCTGGAVTKRCGLRLVEAWRSRRNSCRGRRLGPDLCGWPASEVAILHLFMHAAGLQRRPEMEASAGSTSGVGPYASGCPAGI